MNKFFITAVFLQIFSQSFSQRIPLLDNSNRWILVNNKIDKNEVFLSSYKKAKVKLNTLVLTFAENGKIIYDYETNSKYAENLDIKYLDINVNESSWAFDSLAKTLLLTIQGGYFTLDDFKFQREYTIDEVHDGYILMKSKELIFEDLRKKKVLVNEVRKTALKRVSPNVEMPQILSENKISIENGTKTPKVLADSINYQTNSTKPKLNFSEEKTTGFVENEKTVAAATLLSSVTVPSVKINYFELNKVLFDKTKRWILVRNKIERGDIYLTPYHESKLTINNLVLNLSESGKIEYDYESDPKIKFCAGVDFLDIDTDETSWVFDSENNVFTLTLKGGYASLDDFKFKREYTLEAFDDGFALRKVKEYYFNDLRRPVKTSRKYSKKRK
jgi:hypothetical protein